MNLCRCEAEQLMSLLEAKILLIFPVALPHEEALMNDTARKLHSRLPRTQEHNKSPTQRSFPQTRVQLIKNK